MNRKELTKDEEADEIISRLQKPLERRRRVVGGWAVDINSKDYNFRYEDEEINENNEKKDPNT